ncbi:plasmid pRiA4b ORF-3 family protein [Paenisporosarcina sp. TG20]|uniref:plasmid pRiA4b ORF-3 family protein n=1 Tax=Paenisporosarcina sp. TG20 TaxID=1211706 RepID=UPI0002F82041|nr:plasmid pRiA4b ORF-3 family protein [Paenisporosarcina sp. TG20]
MILQFKVQIKYTKPTVLRRLQVEDQTTFNDFHKVLQIAFDWEDSHLHGYQMKKVEGRSVNDVSIGLDDGEEFGLLQFSQFDELEEKLADWFLMERDKGIYTYDFGDNWEHEIVLEKILQPKENVFYPHCLKAVEIAPEEDSRGMEEWREPVEMNELTSQVNEKLKPLTKLPKSQLEDSNVWKQLIEKMKELNAATPWSWIYDDQVFIVEDPITKEKLFVSVLGGAGQEFGLAVYIGQEGYRSLKNIMENKMSTDELVLVQRSILASFVDRGELESDDYSLLKKLGMSFRGKKQWPQFRSFKPGDYPWSIDEEEVRLLVVAIEQTLVMLRKVKAGLMVPVFLEDEEFFARVLLNDGTWGDDSISVREIEVNSRQTELELYISEIELKRVKNLPANNMLVEFDVFHMMLPVQPVPDARPYFPLMVVAMDAQEGLAIHQNMYEGKNRAEIIQLGFIEMMMVLGNIPSEVWVKEETYKLLQPLLKKIKVNVVQVEELQQVDQLKAFLIEMNR